MAGFQGPVDPVCIVNPMALSLPAGMEVCLHHCPRDSIIIILVFPANPVPAQGRIYGAGHLPFIEASFEKGVHAARRLFRSRYAFIVVHMKRRNMEARQHSGGPVNLRSKHLLQLLVVVKW